ncbi:hypothetical protein ACOYR1_03945 [Thalassotalea piscium]
MSNNIISWIKTKVKSNVLSLVKYYDGKLYDIVQDSDGRLILVPSTSSTAIKFVVVARHHYQESIEQYPIENPKELNKILVLKYPDKVHTKYRVCNSENNQSQVNVWHFDHCVPPAMFTLPETLLFAQRVKANELLTVNDSDAKSLYISRFGNAVNSAVQSTLIKDATIFALSAGISADEVKAVEKTELLADIVFPFSKLPLSILPSFAKPAEKLFSVNQVKWALLPVAALFIINLVITSLYIKYKQSDLETSMEQYNQQFSEMLNNQQEMERNYQRYDALKQFFSTQKKHLPFLIAMSDVFPKIQLSNIRVDDGRYIIRGYTTNALNLLTVMNNHEMIDDAKFDFPVRKGAKREFFVISFKHIETTEVTDNTGSSTDDLGASING